MCKWKLLFDLIGQHQYTGAHAGPKNSGGALGAKKVFSMLNIKV